MEKDVVLGERGVFAPRLDAGIVHVYDFMISLINVSVNIIK